MEILSSRLFCWRVLHCNDSNQHHMWKVQTVNKLIWNISRYLFTLLMRLNIRKFSKQLLPSRKTECKWWLQMRGLPFSLSCLDFKEDYMMAMICDPILKTILKWITHQKLIIRTLWYWYTNRWIWVWSQKYNSSFWQNGLRTLQNTMFLKRWVGWIRWWKGENHLRWSEHSFIRSLYFPI